MEETRVLQIQERKVTSTSNIGQAVEISGRRITVTTCNRQITENKEQRDVKVKTTYSRYLNIRTLRCFLARVRQAKRDNVLLTLPRAIHRRAVTHGRARRDPRTDFFRRHGTMVRCNHNLCNYGEGRGSGLRLSGIGCDHAADVHRRRRRPYDRSNRRRQFAATPFYRGVSEPFCMELPVDKKTVG